MLFLWADEGWYRLLCHLAGVTPPHYLLRGLFPSVFSIWAEFSTPQTPAVLKTIFPTYRILGWFFQHFKNTAPLPPGLHGSMVIWMTIPLKVKHNFFSGCFHNVFVVFRFQQFTMCPGMDLFGLILLLVKLTQLLESVDLCLSPNLESFQHYFFSTAFFSSPSVALMTQMLHLFSCSTSSVHFFGIFF